MLYADFLEIFSERFILAINKATLLSSCEKSLVSVKNQSMSEIIAGAADAG